MKISWKTALTRARRGRNWISIHKSGIGAALIAIATMFIFINSKLESDEAKFQANLIYQVGMVTVANSAFTANNSELELQRSVAEMCLNNPQTTIIEKGSCGSNKVLLQGAALSHDPLEADEEAAANEASTTITAYKKAIPALDDGIAFTGDAALLALVLSIIVILIKNKPMVFIIGIDHRYQTGSDVSQDKLDDFKKTISNLLTNGKIRILGEEFSEEAATDNRVKQSIPQGLAESYNAQYIFADPNRMERSALGINSRQETAESLGIPYPARLPTPDEEKKINLYHRGSDEKREQEWLRRIRPYLNEDIIFICGFGHAEEFGHLLKAHRFNYTIHKIYNTV